MTPLLLDAYLDGFEHAEYELKLISKKLVSEIEKQFIKTRASANDASPEILTKNIDILIKLLEQSLASIQTKKQNSTLQKTYLWGEFISSFTIILREGFEAFLIIIALLSLVNNIGSNKTRKAHQL